MTLEIPNVSVIYPNEDNAKDRTLTLHLDGELLQFDFDMNTHPNGGFCMTKADVKLLRDGLNMVLNNKLLD